MRRYEYICGECYHKWLVEGDRWENCPKCGSKFPFRFISIIDQKGCKL